VSASGRQQPAEDAMPPIAPPKWRLGVAVFQNDKMPTNGVALVHGRAPIMFDSRTNLPSDVIWVSSADQGDVAQNFRPKAYLRSTLDAVADDLGVELRDVVHGMPMMALLMQQVMDIVRACYDFKDPFVAWAKPSLNEVLREGIARLGDAPLSIVGPLRDAMQPYSWVPDRIRTDFSAPMSHYTLRHNRLEYAQYLLLSWGSLHCLRHGITSARRALMSCWIRRALR